MAGEVGTSGVKNRIRKGQLKCIWYILEEGNNLVKSIGEQVMVRMQQKCVYVLLSDGVIENRVRGETKESIRRKMRELDTREWKEMNEETSLLIYKNWRLERRGQEKIYIITKDHSYHLRADLIIHN